MSALLPKADIQTTGRIAQPIGTLRPSKVGISSRPLRATENEVVETVEISLQDGTFKWLGKRRIRLSMLNLDRLSLIPSLRISGSPCKTTFSKEL